MNNQDCGAENQNQELANTEIEGFVSSLSLTIVRQQRALLNRLPGLSFELEQEFLYSHTNFTDFSNDGNASVSFAYIFQQRFLLERLSDLNLKLEQVLVDPRTNLSSSFSGANGNLSNYRAKIRQQKELLSWLLDIDLEHERVLLDSHTNLPEHLKGDKELKLSTCLAIINQQKDLFNRLSVMNFRLDQVLDQHF